MERTNPLTSRRGGLVAGSILIVALLTSGFLAKRTVEPNEVDHAPAEALVGMVRPTDVGTIAAAAPMTIAEVLVAVGDDLEAGHRIARRDIVEEERALAQLGLTVERAQQDTTFREQAPLGSNNQLPARDQDPPASPESWRWPNCRRKAGAGTSDPRFRPRACVRAALARQRRAEDWRPPGWWPSRISAGPGRPAAADAWPTRKPRPMRAPGAARPSQASAGAIWPSPNSAGRPTRSGAILISTALLKAAALRFEEGVPRPPTLYPRAARGASST